MAVVAVALSGMAIAGAFVRPTLDARPLEQMAWRPAVADAPHVVSAGTVGDAVRVRAARPRLRQPDAGVIAASLQTARDTAPAAAPHTQSASARFFLGDGHARVQPFPVVSASTPGDPER
jgi:hypothetical protein